MENLKYDLKLSPGAVEIIRKINDAGYEAYGVGGCVRDMIMGKTPHDFDITSSALPEEVKDALAGYRIIDTGLKHGTVTVVLDGEPFEVTTYRIDGEYLDNRRPSEVFFTRNLRDDLSRRDFTVNAMAYNEKEGIVDLFGGGDDIRNKVIRAVGDPEKRFNEDGLRILRALRFAATLDFEIEEKTADAVHKLNYLLDNISKERIFSELCKLICGTGASRVLRDFPDVLSRIIPEAASMVGFDQQNPYHAYDVYEHTLHALDWKCDDRYVKLAILFHDIGKPYVFSKDEKGGHFYRHPEVSTNIAETALKRLKSDGNTVKIVTKLVSEHHRDIKPNAKSVRRLLAALGEENAHRLITLRRADNSALVDWLVKPRLDELDEIETVMNDIISEGECLSLKNLPVKGEDLIALGMKPGKSMGDMLNELLSAAIDGKLPVDRSAMLDYVKSKLE